MTDIDQEHPDFNRRRSIADVIRYHPVLFIAAFLLGGVVVGTLVMLALTLVGDDEAPIRVRNGSVWIELLSTKEKFERYDSDHNFGIKNAGRFKEEFEVTVAPRAGANCAPSLTATGKQVLITYADGTNADWKVRFESSGKRTRITGDNDALASDGAYALAHGDRGQGYIKEIAVGAGANPPVLCSFTQAAQLDHLIILNVPR